MNKVIGTLYHAKRNGGKFDKNFSEEKVTRDYTVEYVERINDNFNNSGHYIVVDEDATQEYKKKHAQNVAERHARRKLEKSANADVLTNIVKNLTKTSEAKEEAKEEKPKATRTRKGPKKKVEDKPEETKD